MQIVLYLVMLVLFFGVMIAVGFVCRRKSRTSQGFMLGGRSVGPWLTAFAYGTSYFSAVVFVGYAGQFGWKFGVSSTWIGLGNALLGSLLAWVVLGRRTRVMTQHLHSSTMSDFFAKRYFSPALKIAAAIIIFVFLILCALYESIFVPLAVMLSVPFGLMGSFLFAKMWGLENNIYMQTGLIMLIGLLAKTAILLTEYASARRRQGMTIAQAAVSAAGVRLRPILMTALTMIIGLFPLVVASGAGANGNISLGVGAVGGMIVGTLALLFVVPTLFIVFQTLQERLMPARKHEED